MSRHDDQPIDQKRLQAAMEAAGLHLWERALSDLVMMCRPGQVMGELGYSDAAAARLGNSLLSIVHPGDAAACRGAAAAHLAGESAYYRCEFRIRNSSGAWVWYANHGKVIADGPKLERRRMAGVTFNIDERKQTELRLLIEQQRLADSEARHRALLDNLRIAIVAHDRDGRILYSNPRAAELLGMSQAEMLGHSVRDPVWHIVDEEGRRLGAEEYPVCEVLHTLRPMERTVVGVRRADNGALSWVQVDAFPELNADGSLKQVVVNFDDISHRKLAEKEIHELAFFDPLTRLPNRRMLMDRLHAAMSGSDRSGLYGAVLYIDLDNFKAINDLLGHAVGDQLLVEVAGRVAGCLRDNDIVARLGGDEFVVLVGDLATDADASSQKVAHIAEKIRSSLTLPFRLGGRERHSSPSIGVAMFLGMSKTEDAVLRQADMAMYKAKEGGRNTFRFFSPAMQLAVETRAALEHDLRNAVPGGQLRLLYQPQIDDGQRVIGAEALLRWLHPTRGTVSPLEFIPIAEESGLILEVGGWVLESACAQLAAWHLDPGLADLTLSVNVSARQFRQPDFVSMMEALLARHRFDTARLKLELTETLVLTDIEDVAGKMALVQRLGINLSMDDFGTGYSSLAYLKRLPLDQIKIDQSFVRDITTDPTDAVMVKTIIDLARNFHLHAIAEGVETQEQSAFLHAHGCLAFQGFLFGRPMPVEAFEAQVRTSHALAAGLPPQAAIDSATASATRIPSTAADRIPPA